MNVWCDGSDYLENEIRVEVRCLIGKIYPGGDFIDRRGEHRYPFSKWQPGQPSHKTGNRPYPQIEQQRRP